MSDAERPAIRTARGISLYLFWIILSVIVPVSMALAEIADKVEETRASHDPVTGILLLLTALAAASGWRRALLLWPVTLVWGLVAFGTVWEWREELQREGASTLLWEGGATGAAMLLGPPLFAGLARQWHRMRPG